MIDLANIAPTILENFAKLIPGRMVHDYERGVRFTKGRARRAQLEQGWWWFLPLYQSIAIVSVKDQVKDIATQSLTTRDDIPVSASLCVEYEIFDAVLWQTEVHDFDESLHANAKIYLGRAIPLREYDYLRKHKRRVERSIAAALSSDVERWGVRITKVGLETFVRARQYRLMQT